MVVKLRLYTRDAKAVLEVLERLATFHIQPTEEQRGIKLNELGNWGVPADHGVIGANVLKDLQTSSGRHAVVADYLTSIHDEIAEQLKRAVAAIDEPPASAARGPI